LLEESIENKTHERREDMLKASSLSSLSITRTSSEATQAAYWASAVSKAMNIFWNPRGQETAAMT
jgi:hypothetical protein